MIIDFINEMFRGILPDPALKNLKKVYSYGMKVLGLTKGIRVVRKGNLKHLAFNGAKVKFPEEQELTDTFISLPSYFLKWEIKDAVVVDAGAYPGDFSLIAAKNGCKVIAVEPNPENFRKLQKNIVLNKLENKIILIEKALGSYCGKRRIYLNEYVTSFYYKSDREKEVDVITLDELISNLGINKVDFVKMDVEGAELDVLKGMDEILENGCKLMIGSYHKVYGKRTYPFVEQFLKKKGYNVLTMYPLHLVTYAWKTQRI